MELYNNGNASPTVYKSFAEQLEEDIEKIKQEGIEQGKGLKSQETAIKMLRMGLDLELISEVTGLALEKLHELREGNP